METETCLWCTAENDGVVLATLQRYCAGSMSPLETRNANRDLIGCGECVVTYHGARESVPALHKRLWELETGRLLDIYQQQLEVELEDADVLLVSTGPDQPVLGSSADDFINSLRIPLMEVLMYPYLLSHRDLCELVVNAICKIQELRYPLAMTAKYHGIYLLMVHPNEMVRRWAITAARSLGRVDRDRYYDLEEIFSCMFYVIELGISLDIPVPDDEYCSGKMQRLPSHLYDSKNEKNYWLGVCMLLMQLDSQAMDSLFMGPEKQANILQCIMNTMTDCRGDEDKASDPFWPALQCFMVILDRLGSKIWIQIEPEDAFKAVTCAASYANEIKNIRQKTTGTRVKLEHEGDDDMVSCSQMVYDWYSSEQGNGWSGCSFDGSGSSVFEEMTCLVNILQSEMGQDMRVYGSTFLWFYPFIRSVVELAELGIVYFVVCYLYNEVDKDVLSGRAHTCDKVTEFFVRILVDIIELHLSKDCMRLLSCCIHEWVQVVVQSATLSDETCFSRILDRKDGFRGSVSGVGAMSRACMKLILILLKRGKRMGTDPDSARFLDLLNIHLREAPSRGWSLTKSESVSLQNCLVKLVTAVSDRSVASPVPSALPTPPAAPQGSSTSTHLPQQPQYKDAETGTRDMSNAIKDEPVWECAENKGLCDGLEMRVKKEPQNPVLISKFKLEFKPDLGKIQEIRSRLNDGQNFSKIQAIAMRKSDFGGGLQGFGDQKSAGRISENTRLMSLKPMTKLSECSKSNLNADSDEDKLHNADSDDDEPLNVRRRHQKASHRELSSDSEDACDSCNTKTLAVQNSSSTKECTDVIVISDDEVDTSDRRLVGDCPGSGTSKAKLKFALDPVTNENPGREYDDQSESQVFEFETQENIVSAWSNSSLDGPVVTKKHKLDTSSEACPSDADPVSGWVTETQAVPDEDMAKACEHVEEQISKRQQLKEPSTSSMLVSAKPSNSPDKRDDFVQYIPLCSKSPTKKPAMAETKGKQGQNKKTLLIEPLSQKLNRRWRASSAQELDRLPSSTTPSFEFPFTAAPSVSSSVPSGSSHHSTPAIVPPKKVRKPVVPESVAERLGLKKRERKAFELSQRTLDSVGVLRSYGQNVHVESQPKSKRIRGEGKPQQKLCRKGRKKLLASQDMQYYRQSRGQSRQKQMGTSTAPPKPTTRPVPKPLSKPKCAPKGSEEPGRAEGEGEEEEEEEDDDDDDDDYFLPCSQPDPDQKADSTKSVKRVKISLPDEFGNSRSEQNDNVVCEESRSESRSFLKSKSTDGRGGSSKAECAKITNNGSGFDDDEWWCLTQNEATDMELCSQMEEMEMCGLDNSTQRDPVDMDIDTHDEPDTTNGDTGAPAQPVSTYVSARSSLDDGLFLTPALPPVTQKKAKPSTTKIYASVSRSASLAIEMEKTLVPLPPGASAKAKLKAAHPSLPVPLVCPPAKVTPAPQPPNRIVPSKPLMRSPTLTSKASLPHSNQATKLPYRPILHSLNQVPKSTDPLAKNITTSQQRSYKTCPRPEASTSVPVGTLDPTQNYDQSYLTQAVLKWEYRLFEQYKTFGAPDDLHVMPLKKVPTAFFSYQEYFNVLFPLLLLNAFEEMASEWHSGSRVEVPLQLQGIEYSNRTATASFTATLNSEQDTPLYPKEEDLVFLWLPENTGSYANEEPEFHDPLPYLGFVSRSTVYSNGGGQASTLNLKIQTHGNVSSVDTQPVRCKVIGSLVSTLREFRALCLLRHSLMKRTLLAPHASAYVPCQESLAERATPTFYLQENNNEKYNEDQEKVISYGVAMVKRSQKIPKILLIHGPPGTGKSKTIVGLLYKLLSDNSTRTSVNRCGKSCRMRILVCTPSNAAIDNLMKKIITVFKEKSKNPQGNCGDINLVRLGNEKTILQTLSPFSLDSQIKAKTQKTQQVSDSQIQRQKEDLDQLIDETSRKCAKMRSKQSVEFQQLLTKKAHYMKEREMLCRLLRENRSKRQELQARLLQDANVICCTLSTSGSAVLEGAFRRLGHEPFSCVIIDEAGQAKETETLIPFLHRCPSLILVGDPEQLPPTVVSQKAKELDYDQSLMARLMKSLRLSNPHLSTSVFLSVQYRMHPDICEFPSKYIYNKRLKNDCTTAEKRCSASWPFESYRVFDVTDGQESREGDSFCNPKEVKLAVLLLQLILEKQVVRVGVITPYKAQKRSILEKLRQQDPCNRFSLVEVNTVDGFQGRDMDCIIVSCVRASSEMGSIGFVGNRQRMNVTITRAKSSLFILGHLRTLKEQNDWGALVEDAVRRGTIIKTHERDFHNAIRKILKPELLSRSDSYPPVGVFPPVTPGPADAVPARVSRAHRLSEPSRSHVSTVSLTTSGQSYGASLSRTHTDVPRDPRLAHRPSDPRLAQPVRELDRERRGMQDPRQPIRGLERERQSTRDPGQRTRSEAYHRDNSAHEHSGSAFSSRQLPPRKQTRYL